MIQILVVEDESIIARDIQDCLESLGYSVPATAATGLDAIQKATELRPDLILMDIRLKGEIDGIQAAERIWNSLQIPIIYATGFSDRDTLERAKLTQPFGYILKPIEEQELYAAVETALHQYRANQDLQHREQWLTTVLRDIGDGVIVVDTQDRIRLMNLVAEALTGWTQTEALGKSLAEVFKVIHKQTQTPLESPTAEVLAEGKMIYLPENILLLSKTGATVPIADTATPIWDETGTITGAVIVFRDVTQRQIAEERDLALRRTQQLEAQMAELRKLNQLKDDFLNTVSHELRTPLANMKMAIQMLEIMLDQEGLLEVDLLSSRTVHYLEILREQCNHELSLINDLLDLQRLNADIYPLTFSSIHLQDWIPHVAEHFEERIHHQQQSLCIVIPPDLPSLISDASGLTRILTELLNNACKYTPIAGTIDISANLSAQTTDFDRPVQPNQSQLIPYPSSSTLPFESAASQYPSSHFSHSASLQIHVCNSGIELASEELTRVFEQFYRIPNSDLHNQGGTGLGLALVKRLVTCLSGNIWAESHPGQTCFIVELPLIPPELSLS